MKNNKGFVGIGLILAIIAALVVGGGAVYYAKKTPITVTKNIPIKVTEDSSKKVLQDTKDYQKAKVVNLTGLDGCGFEIELENGIKIEPINLSDEFKKDKLPVLIKYKERPDFNSICMVGKTVELTDIVSNDLVQNSGIIVSPTIKVLSPNGGEIIQVGKSYAIKWNAVGFSSSDTVSLELKDDSISCLSRAVGCQNKFFISDVKNTGSYIWNTNQKMSGPSTGPNSISIYPGSSFRINLSIYSKNNSSVLISDSSDKLFTIKSENNLVSVSTNPYISNMTNNGPMTGASSYFLVKKNITSNNTMYYYNVYSDIYSLDVPGERYIKDGKIYYNPAEQNEIVKFGSGISGDISTFKQNVNQEIVKKGYAVVKYSFDGGPLYINYTLVK